MSSAGILDLLRRAVRERQIKVSLHAAEEALAEGITRGELEAAMLGAEVLENIPTGGWAHPV